MQSAAAQFLKSRTRRLTGRLRRALDFDRPTCGRHRRPKTSSAESARRNLPGTRRLPCTRKLRIDSLAGCINGSPATNGVRQFFGALDSGPSEPGGPLRSQKFDVSWPRIHRLLVAGLFPLAEIFCDDPQVINRRGHRCECQPRNAVLARGVSWSWSCESSNGGAIGSTRYQALRFLRHVIIALSVLNW